MVALETVVGVKQQRIVWRGALFAQYRSAGSLRRFDVVSVLWQEKGRPLVELYKDAF